MRYFRINNDLGNVSRLNPSVDDIGIKIFRYWMETGYAYTTANFERWGHERSYERFGVNALGKLSEGDIVFIYENGSGVLAAGTVQEAWDEEKYAEDDGIYATSDEIYKIRVDWFLDFYANPVRLQDYNISYFRLTVYELPEEVGQRVLNDRQQSRIVDADLRDVSMEHDQISFEEAVQRSLRDSRESRRKRLNNAPRQPELISTITTAFRRNPDVVAEVLERANGICENQRCRKPAPFMRVSDNSPYLEVHHKIPLSQGGDDTVENAIALCPNCHREAHFGDLNFDGE